MENGKFFFLWLWCGELRDEEGGGGAWKGKVTYHVDDYFNSQPPNSFRDLIGTNGGFSKSEPILMTSLERERETVMSPLKNPPADFFFHPFIYNILPWV